MSNEPSPVIRKGPIAPLGGKLVAVNNEIEPSGEEIALTNGAKGGLPFDEEAKLVYGVVLSLRNMIKKLTGRFARFPCLSFLALP